MANANIELNCIEQVEIQDDFVFGLVPGDEEYIFKDGIIRRSAYWHILNEKFFAERYLQLIRTGEIEFDWQTQNLVLLDILADKIKGGNWNFRDLATLFQEAMQVMREKSAQALAELQNHEEIVSAVSDGFDYAEFDGAIFATIVHARRAAVQGMINKFAEQYGVDGGYKGDLYGSYRLLLTKPRVKGVEKKLVHRYMEGEKVSARISKISQNTWQLQFFDLIPFSELNRLNLAIETYHSAAIVLEHALELGAAVHWELND